MKTRNLVESYLLIIIIILTGFSVLTLARYITSIYGLSSARVAIFANNTSTTLEDISGKPGLVTIVPIEITNFNAEKISEVNSKFTINISHDYGKNLPLVFNLYKDKECSEIIYRDENENFFDDEFTFKALQKGTKKVYLKIEWPKEENSMQNVFEIDHLTVNFRVSQID